jgi:hypothetical protein
MLLKKATSITANNITLQAQRNQGQEELFTLKTNAFNGGCSVIHGFFCSAILDSKIAIHQ